MANTIQVKRSAVAGTIPTATALALGELAINTFDGKLFLKRDNGTETIIEIGQQGPAGTNGSPDTATQVLAKLLTVDGGSSGLDADLLDGLHANSFLRSDVTSTLFGGQASALAFENQGTFFRFSFNELRWYDWNNGFDIFGLNGHAWCATDIRAPIFYDYQDTNYYVDPNGTSRLSRLVADRGLGDSGGHHTLAANIGAAVPTWNNTQLELRNTDGGNVGIAFHRSGYTVASLYHGGGDSLNVTGSFVAAGNIQSTSDLRFKTNITLIDRALEKVRALRGVVYDRTDINDRQTGVIAQDVRAVLPEAVGGSEEDGLTVAYGNLAGLLIEAIKDLATEVDRLKDIQR